MAQHYPYLSGSGANLVILVEMLASELCKDKGTEEANGAAGRLCENSLEALTDLIQRDLDGSLEPGGLAYVEFDVHVSQLAPLNKCFHLASLGSQKGCFKSLNGDLLHLENAPWPHLLHVTWNLKKGKAVQYKSEEGLDRSCKLTRSISSASCQIRLWQALIACAKCRRREMGSWLCCMICRGS